MKNLTPMKELAYKQIRSLEQRSFIESNKQFKRLNEKTQVLVPQNGMVEVPQSRLTHSYEVETSSLLIALNIAQQLNVSLTDIDYQFAVQNASLLHDIGHPAFGHDGADVIDEFFREKGVSEGFSDNNNNLIVLEKNDIVVDDYTKVSIIKYPTKLYENQKKMYLPLLSIALKEDKEHYKKVGINLSEKNTTTIACQIMDEADRNTYVCSDLNDFFCLGNKIDLISLVAVARKMNIFPLIKTFVYEMNDVISSGNKSHIKEYFNSVTNMFNKNHKLTDDGIQFIDQSLFYFREYLSKLTHDFFIASIREDAFHLNNIELLKEYLDFVCDNDYYPSSHYSKLIHQTDNEIDKMTLIRDMVSEVSDWYIFCFARDLNLGKVVTN